MALHGVRSLVRVHEVAVSAFNVMVGEQEALLAVRFVRRLKPSAIANTAVNTTAADETVSIFRIPIRHIIHALEEVGLVARHINEMVVVFVVVNLLGQALAKDAAVLKLNLCSLGRAVLCRDHWLYIGVVFLKLQRTDVRLLASARHTDLRLDVVVFNLYRVHEQAVHHLLVERRYRFIQTLLG